MGSAVVIVRHPFVQDAVEMPVVERDDEIQTLASKGANDPFTNRIRHGRPYWRFEHAQPQIPYTLVNVFGEYRVPVTDQETIGVIDRDRFSELLHGPLSRGMGRHIDVKEAADDGCAPWRDIALLIQGELLAKKGDFRSQSRTGP